MSIDLVYFGHPITLFNTSKERELIDRIQEEFPQAHITNPADQPHSKNYEEYKRRYGDGMKYYLEVVLPAHDAGVFLPFADGYFGAGVHTEAQRMEELGKPVYQISKNGHVRPLTVHPRWRLTVEQTRARVYDN